MKRREFIKAAGVAAAGATLAPAQAQTQAAAVPLEDAERQPGGHAAHDAAQQFCVERQTRCRAGASDRGADQRRHRQPVRDSRCGQQGRHRRRPMVDALRDRQASGRRPVQRAARRLRQWPRPDGTARLVHARRRPRALRRVLPEDAADRRHAVPLRAGRAGMLRLVQEADHVGRRVHQAALPHFLRPAQRRAEGHGRRADESPRAGADPGRRARHHRRRRMDQSGERPAARIARRVQVLLDPGPASGDRHRGRHVQRREVAFASARSAGDRGDRAHHLAVRRDALLRARERKGPEGDQGEGRDDLRCARGLRTRLHQVGEEGARQSRGEGPVLQEGAGVRSGPTRTSSCRIRARPRSSRR